MEEAEPSQDQKILNKGIRVFNWSKWMSKGIGVWPLEPNYYIFNVTFSYFTIVMILEYVDLYYSLDDFDKVIDNLTENLAFSIIYVRTLVLRVHIHTLREIITESLKDFNEDTFKNSKEIRIFMSHINKGTFFAKFIIIFTLMTEASWYVRPLTSAPSPSNNSLTPENETIFLLPYHFYVFYEISSVKIWKLTYLSHTPFVVISGLGTATANVFLIAIVYDISGKLAVLTERINLLKVNDKGFNKDLEEIITEHVKLLKMGENVKDSYATALLVYLVNTQIVMCIIGFQILVTLTKGANSNLMQYFVFIVTVYLIMAIMCSISENLSTTSTQVCQAYWSISWYDMQQKYATNIAIALLRSQKPLGLQAGKFKYFGYMTLTDVTQKSFGYLSVLRNFMIAEEN